MPEKNNEFSIIIPTFERPNLTIRAIQSIQGQIYPHWELIVIDDGSREEYKEKIENYIKSQNDPRIKIIHYEGRKQRVIARNVGIKNATKEWLCHLDSDDEYLRTYLNSANWAINEYPQYSCFHGGAVVCRLKEYSIREPFEIKEEGNGMEKFRSGRIGMGSFFYKRSLHDEIGCFPETGSPYRFADMAKDEMPEIMEWYGKKYLEGGKELGNPWGEDWYLFYKITRKYKSKKVPLLTYIHFIRRSGFIEQDEDRLLNRNNVVIP